MRLSSHWREAKKPNREEKEKLKNNFSHFERRKRNLNSLSPISRREREIRIPLPCFESRKRNPKFFCPVSRGERETWIPFQSFERRKRNLKFSFPVSRGEREIGEKIFNFQDLRVPEMSLRVPKSKFRDHFWLQTSNQNLKKNSSGTKNWISKSDFLSFCILEFFLNSDDTLPYMDIFIYESRKRHFKCCPPILRV